MIEKLSKYLIGILIGLIVALIVFAIVVVIISKVQGTTLYQLFNIAGVGAEEIALCLNLPL